MSHIFKNENKKYFLLFKYLFIIFITFLFYAGLVNYSGNWIIYSSFSLVSNFLFFFGFRKNSIFFETFMCLLLWLGFWFKFTCTIAFTDGVFREGVGQFGYSTQEFDQTLVISQIGILAFIIGGFIREFFIFKYPNKINFDFKGNYNFFDNRKLIWSLFILIIFLISIINFHLKIYQKGLLPVQEFHFLFSGIFKWLLLFGLTSLSAFLIFNEVKKYKKFFLLSSIIIYFETFLSSFSMLSRGMIFNAFALMYGIYKFSNKINLKNKIRYYFKSTLIVFLLFYISVASVNYIRANFFYVGKSAEFTKEIFAKSQDSNQTTNKKQKSKQKSKKKYSTFNQHNSEILYLLINRWVGIDGVMAVVAKQEILNFNFLFESFKERPIKNKSTFYESTFGLETISYEDQIYENVKGNTLPGIIAFLFYSGSYLLLFFSIIFLSIVASLIEFLAFKLSSQNLIFSSVIGQIIAFRFIHFGYLPHQSYLLFGTIFLTILIVYLLNLINNKFTK